MSLISVVGVFFSDHYSVLLLSVHLLQLNNNTIDPEKRCAEVLI